MLDTPITTLGRITEPHKKALHKLGIVSCRDLLYHFPVRYNDIAEIKSIASILPNTEVILYGELSKVELKPGFGGAPKSTRAVLSDHTGSVKLIWFNQVYISKMYPSGSLVKISGKVTNQSGGLSVVNPDIIKTKNLPIDSSDSIFQVEAKEDQYLTPVYAETKGITSRYLQSLIQKCVGSNYFDDLVDPIPKAILKKYNIPELREALLYIHFPKSENHALVARKRIAFEEVFLLQLERARDRFVLDETPGFVIENNVTRTNEFLSQFPFSLTASQEKAINDILTDFKKGTPMSRLIEGDVGSGKTAVAATVAHLAAITRPYIASQKKRQDFGTLQVAYMAPTEILARQHFENFIEYFRGSGLSIGLITGSKCLKFPSKINIGGYTEISRAQLGKWVASGEIAVVVGTHALIQKNVQFKHLALCIIDEQHRFGVKQRKALVSKRGAAGETTVPHLLSMTATPIPRTLALSIYGDLDLTLVDQMPLGRKKTITEIVTPLTRSAMYDKILTELESGRQAYIICPRIDEPDESTLKAMQTKSVEVEAKKLQNTIFKDYIVGVLHGKMKPIEKDAVMKQFAAGTIDILVATSVVEVGVSVANATLIIIEGADRFGLSQLHQLRGRVIRSSHQSYCFICSESTSEKTVERLQALVTAKDGFELAELDLALRGSGGLTAGKQWGVSDIAMEAIKNVKLVEAARASAREIVETDINLNNYPLLKEVLSKREKTHFE